MSGTHHQPKVAALILAAGASTRMSTIKQLLPWKRSNLLSHVIGQLKEAGLFDVYVVLGAHSEEIKAGIDTSGITVIENEAWQEGMASSIAQGLGYMEKLQLHYDGVLLATCDQPLIKIDHYNKLFMSCINNHRIIASSYGNSFGIPVVFGREYFGELTNLDGDTGAKQVIKKHLGRLIQVDASEGWIDLDTPEAYQKYFPIFGKDT